jgi:DNA polymerase-3 subunit alpha
MAAMVEGVDKGRTKRGAEFIRAEFSDQSGQFRAACFEESLVGQFEKWAADGACLLLTVELDSPNPDEPPRITVRGARPFSEVQGAMRMMLTLDIATEEALQALRLELQESDGEHGEVVARLLIEEHAYPAIRLGRNFKLDGELAERLQSIDGLAKIEIKPANGRADLKLVA